MVLTLTDLNLVYFHRTPERSRVKLTYDIKGFYIYTPNIRLLGMTYNWGNKEVTMWRISAKMLLFNENANAKRNSPILNGHTQ